MFKDSLQFLKGWIHDSQASETNSPVLLYVEYGTGSSCGVGGVGWGGSLPPPVSAHTKVEVN